MLFYLTSNSENPKICLEVVHIKFSNAFLIQLPFAQYSSYLVILTVLLIISSRNSFSLWLPWSYFIPTSTTDYCQNLSVGLFLHPLFPLPALSWPKFLLLISILHKVDCWCLPMEFPLWRMAILVITPPVKKLKKCDKIILKYFGGN